MSDDDDWMGDTDPNNVAGVAAGAAPPAGPWQVAPGVWAGDFVNGGGVLEIRVDPAVRASAANGSAAVDCSKWGRATSPPAGIDVYEWGRRLGDQGIAYQINDGKISVFEKPETVSDGKQRWTQYRAENTDDYVPGQTSDQPSDWRQYAAPRLGLGQDLSCAFPQDLGAYGQANAYLFRDGPSAALGQTVQAANVPTVMIPDTFDRFEHRQGAHGIIYWNPMLGLQTPGDASWTNAWNSIPGSAPVQSPAMGLDHERGHVAEWLNDPIGYILDLYTPLGDGFDNLEEKRNIGEVETPAVERIGEPTRPNHGGGNVFVAGPAIHTPMPRRK